MKFTIRDLLLVTVIVAMAVAWWVDHRQQGIERLSLIKSVREADNRFTMLRDMVELDGSKVTWEMKEDGLDMKIGYFPAENESGFSNSPVPASNPPKRGP